MAPANRAVSSSRVSGTACTDTTFAPQRPSSEDEIAEATLVEDDPAEAVLVEAVLVDPDPVLHRDRFVGRGAHRLHDPPDVRWVGHEAGAETSLPHLLARAAHVEIDLVVAAPGRQAGAA